MEKETQHPTKSNKQKYRKTYSEKRRKTDKYKEYMKEYRHNYYIKNKSKILKKTTDYYYKNHEQNMKVRRKYNREELQNAKKATFDVLGNKCVYCGFSDIRALQIDHINGDGYLERKKHKGTHVKFYMEVLQSYLKNENKYQLLCANCNWIKRVNNNETKYHGTYKN